MTVVSLDEPYQGTIVCPARAIALAFSFLGGLALLQYTFSLIAKKRPGSSKGGDLFLRISDLSADCHGCFSPQGLTVPSGFFGSGSRNASMCLRSKDVN